MHNIYAQLLRHVATSVGVRDAQLNKITRNLTSLQPRHVNIKPAFWSASELHTHSRTHPFNCLGLKLPGRATTRKLKPVWILLKQEKVSGFGMSWAICKSASRSRQITMPATHQSVFYRLYALPATQPTASKH